MIKINKYEDILFKLLNLCPLNNERICVVEKYFALDVIYLIINYIIYFCIAVAFI